MDEFNFQDDEHDTGRRIVSAYNTVRTEGECSERHDEHRDIRRNPSLLLMSGRRRDNMFQIPHPAPWSARVIPNVFVSVFRSRTGNFCFTLIT